MWVSIVASELISAVLVSALSIIFRGRITYDYLITSAVTSLLAALLIVSAILLLVNQIKTTLNTLQESESRLAELNATLEQRVAERTQALERSNQEAQHANRLKSEFLANVSHELRTPLNAVLGYTQILSRNGGLSDQQRDGIQIIDSSGRHLLTLIEDILDISRIEARHMELVVKDFDLGRLLQSLADTVRPRAEDKGLIFVLEAPLTGLPPVRGDENRLRQVLMNLLNNAIKYTDAGSILFKVTRQQDTYRFEVKDAGIGIAPDELQVIFEPFRQAANTHRRREGTGLGLAISRQLVRFMSGELQVESQVGVGSRFWFEIELPPDKEAVFETQPLEVPVDGYAGERRTLLVVDDELANRQMLVDMLSPLGFEMFEAVDGQDGLEKTIQYKPDALLLDLRMPIMNGFELVQKLRADPDIQDAVVIAISASAFEHDRDRSLAAGCDAFLAKPFRQYDLLDLLASRLQIEWIYGAGSTAYNHKLSQRPESAVPPPSTLQRLLELARQGDVVGIQELVARLAAEDARYTAFCEDLGELAASFKVKRIRQVLDDLIQASQAPWDDSGEAVAQTHDTGPVQQGDTSG